MCIFENGCRLPNGVCKITLGVRQTSRRIISYREASAPDVTQFSNFTLVPAWIAPENEAAQYTKTKMLKPKASAMLSTFPVPRKQVPNSAATDHTKYTVKRTRRIRGHHLATDSVEHDKRQNVVSHVYFQPIAALCHYMLFDIWTLYRTFALDVPPFSPDWRLLSAPA